jgi:hypothetical protein
MTPTTTDIAGRYLKKTSDYSLGIGKQESKTAGSCYSYIFLNLRPNMGF